MYKLLGILLLSSLTACGFRPMYGGGGTATPALQQNLSLVFVETIPERNGQVLRNLLIQQLGFGDDPVAPRYTLNVQLAEAINPLGIRKDATSSYGRLTITAKYTLVDATSKKPLLTDTTRAFSGFTIVDSEYAALTAARDARQKVLRQLAETLARRVAVTLSDYETERR